MSVISTVDTAHEDMIVSIYEQVEFYLHVFFFCIMCNNTCLNYQRCICLVGFFKHDALKSLLMYFLNVLLIINFAFYLA